MENNKVVKFKDFKTNERSYKIKPDGTAEKLEFELSKDWHPLKFKVMSFSKKKDLTPFEKGEYVWVIKKNEKIISVFSSEIDEDTIKEFYDKLSKKEEGAELVETAPDKEEKKDAEPEDL